MTVGGAKLDPLAGGRRDLQRLGVAAAVGDLHDAGAAERIDGRLDRGMVVGDATHGLERIVGEGAAVVFAAADVGAERVREGHPQVGDRCRRQTRSVRAPDRWRRSPPAADAPTSRHRRPGCRRGSWLRGPARSPRTAGCSCSLAVVVRQVAGEHATRDRLGHVERLRDVRDLVFGFGNVIERLIDAERIEAVAPIVHAHRRRVGERLGVESPQEQADVGNVVAPATARDARTSTVCVMVSKAVSSRSSGSHARRSGP